MIVLALDQSTKHTGYSLFDGDMLVRSGVLDVGKELPIYERMNRMRRMITDLIRQLNPDMLVFEQVQYQSNQKVYSQLSQLQGFVMCVAFDENLPFYIVEPVVWKSYAKIHGRKRAEQKADTVAKAEELFHVGVSEDEADAIFIGYWAANNIERFYK